MVTLGHLGVVHSISSMSIDMNIWIGNQYTTNPEDTQGSLINFVRHQTGTVLLDSLLIL